jgi:cytochrome d ubiquinol oxidase subunit II
VATGVLALGALALARTEAPHLWQGLAGRPWSLVFHGVTALAAVLALVALVRRAWGAARLLAALQVTLVLWGWGLAQFPYVLPPDVTFTAAAAPPATLWAVLGALAAGTLLLVPSLVYLFRVFKAARAVPAAADQDHARTPPGPPRLGRPGRV